MKNFTEETIECQLQPELPANANITWSPSDHNVRISWNNVRRSRELTVLSSKGQPSYMKTYKCDVTTKVNGITNNLQLQLKAEVKVNGMTNIILVKFFILKRVYVHVVD